ncbi:cardiolipin synthase [Litoreibacter arenae]|uniref:Cardiolipin synthase n=1 Tax=Litoreibacter arenae DSM 19593 TaxID=1123360 RepID=S9RMT5_9RHOB|nr:cardiolipin synthase [Litoreibacter arenae]EPX79420.1 Cardiolipin synthetase [Litoreibacter arenae DSM 19593]
MTIAGVLLALHTLVVIAFTLRILLRDDLSPPARLAWFVVLTLVPFAGSLVYFLFGEVTVGKQAHAAQKTIQEQVQSGRLPAPDYDKYLQTDLDPTYQPAFSYASSVNGFPATGGNTAELMADGTETRDRIVADIDSAQDHVHALYYIWLNDETGIALAEALMRAAQRGVTCRAMADGLGSRALIRSDLWQQMKEAGVQLAIALPLDRPVRTLLTSRIDLRNHRKITVVDGVTTYCGSRNSADPEFRVKAKYAPWVDIMLRFQGPVVAQNQLLFASDWMRATGEVLEPAPPPPAANKGGFPALVTGHGPSERRTSTPQLFATLFGCARHSVTLSTPYFVPDAIVLEALNAAAHRGVDVTLIFPKVNDSWIVAAASRSFYRTLLEAGCTIHEYEGGLLHAKTLTVDGEVSLIGSSNLDLRSFDLNYENNILLHDAETTRKIGTRQSEYIAKSVQIDHSDVVKWPYHKRIWHNAIATIGPVL